LDSQRDESMPSHSPTNALLGIPSIQFSRNML
jgi:hypothetical protein